VDNLTREQRSYCMSRVKNRDTGLERRVRAELRKNGLRFTTHVKALPGRPDIVFTAARVAVFVDGDFWHGYRFPLWKDSLPSFWQHKIATNRDRDKRNFRRLRRMGWTIVRVWQHASRSDMDRVIARIVTCVRPRRSANS
jgi:DNA mismatch endonuclease (patch repair protein)